MTTLAPPASLANSVQSLVDARLDTIERMLMGRVPRPERIAIVHEVESQIFESLGDRDPQSMTCEDMLDILRRLDPPEAYLANEIDGGEPERACRSIHRTSSATTNPQLPLKGEARIGGIAGLCSLSLLLIAAPIVYFIAAAFNSEGILLIGLGGLALLGVAAGLVGLILSIRSRRQGVLPILGMVTACLSLPVWLIACPFLLLSLL